MIQMTLLLLLTVLVAVPLAREVRLDGYGRRPGPRSHPDRDAQRRWSRD